VSVQSTRRPKVRTRFVEPPRRRSRREDAAVLGAGAEDRDAALAAPASVTPSMAQFLEIKSI
jgi:hypothetical protein